MNKHELYICTPLRKQANIERHNFQRKTSVLKHDRALYVNKIGLPQIHPLTFQGQMFQRTTCSNFKLLIGIFFIIHKCEAVLINSVEL